jgi:hypothetical protein
MKRIPLLSFRAKSRNLLLFLFTFLVASCSPTTTTLRFTGNREAVAVTNPEKPKPGNKLEALIGTRKRLFFYLPHDATVTVFHQSVDPEAEKKKLVANLSTGQNTIEIFVLQLRRPLPITGSPTAQTKDMICREPTIANILAGESTEIVGVGRGSWIGTSASSSRRLFLRTIDPDLVIIVGTNGLDLAHAKDFVLRMGSLTFERGR